MLGWPPSPISEPGLQARVGHPPIRDPGRGGGRKQIGDSDNTKVEPFQMRGDALVAQQIAKRLRAIAELAKFRSLDLRAPVAPHLGELARPAEGLRKTPVAVGKRVETRGLAKPYDRAGELTRIGKRGTAAAVRNGKADHGAQMGAQRILGFVGRVEPILPWRAATGDV